MKRTGDYTLVIPCLVTDKKDSYQIKSVEFNRIRNGRAGGAALYTFDIRAKSKHGDCYNRHFHASKLLLKNNSTGKTVIYEANRKGATSHE